MTYENLPDEQEKKYVEELRKRLQGVVPLEIYNDYHFVKRFVRARNYDIDSAETMLLNTVNWREKNKVDSILTDYKPNEICSKYIGIGLLGYHTDDCPIYFCDFGQVDTRGILKCEKKSEVSKYVLYTLENILKNMRQRSKEVNKNIDQIHMIFDFSTFSFMIATHRPTLEVLGELLMMYESYYPETLKQAYMINTSYVFTLIYQVLRPFLTGRTFQKISLIGKDSTVAELQKRFAPDSIPAFLGGNIRDADGDPSCRKLLNINFPVPEELYPDRGVPIPRIPGALKLEINRMSKAEVKLLVLNTGYKIEWEFETRSKDIGFGLFYLETENSTTEPTELIPSHRVETEISPETGLLHCDKRGVYILEFDNTYSWLSPKEIFYTARVVKSCIKKALLTS